MAKKKKAVGRPFVEDKKVFIPIGVRTSKIKALGGYSKAKQYINDLLKSNE